MIDWPWIFFGAFVGLAFMFALRSGDGDDDD